MHSTVLRGRLRSDQARRALAAISFGERCEIACAAVWSLPNQNDLAPRLSPAGARRALEVAVEAFSRQSLLSLKTYLPESPLAANLSVAPPNLMMEAVSAALLPWLAGVPTVVAWHKESRALVEALAATVARSLPMRARTSFGVVAADDHAGLVSLARTSEIVTTLGLPPPELPPALAAAVHSGRVRLSHRGQAISCAWLSQPTLDRLTDELLADWAIHLAEDVIASDQRTTFAPRLVVVEDDGKQIDRIREALACALGELGLRVPLGLETRRERRTGLAWRRFVELEGGQVSASSHGAVAVQPHLGPAVGLRNIAVVAVADRLAAAKLIGGLCPVSSLAPPSPRAVRVGVAREETCLASLTEAIDSDPAQGSRGSVQFAFVGHLHRPPITTWLDGRRPLEEYAEASDGGEK